MRVRILSEITSKPFQKQKQKQKQRPRVRHQARQEALLERRNLERGFQYQTLTNLNSVHVPRDCKTLKVAVELTDMYKRITTIVVGKGEHQIDGDFLEVLSVN